nr:PREDICTED: uncharacterized protein LOC105669234 isoform X7 [Linepithema humile]
MDKSEEILDENMHNTTDKDFHNEVSNVLQPINTTSSKEKITIRDIIPQIIASCVIHCIVIQAGINMAYSTVLLSGLESDNADIKVTENEESWIASLVTITLPVGSLIAGPLMDRFGRKTMYLQFERNT